MIPSTKKIVKPRQSMKETHLYIFLIQFFVNVIVFCKIIIVLFGFFQIIPIDKLHVFS